MAKIKSIEDYEMEGYDLPEIEVVAKDKSKPQTYTHTPTAAEVYDGKLTTDAQTYVPTSEESTVVETKTREPRVRHQRDVNFGEGLAKIASVMGIGQGDGGRDRVAAREQRAADRRERQDARQDARQARQEARDARQDARQAVRDERQALRDARVAENRENRLNAQQVRRDARDVARMEREQSRLGAQQVRDAARQVRQEERDAARQVRVDDRLAQRDARVQSRLDRADERDARVAAARDERVANREEREASRLVRRDEASKERAARVEEIARRRGAREAARVEAENTRDANREARRTERANDRAARQERVDANKAAREDARVERQEVRDERREARVADRQTARQERVDARQGERASRMEENVGLLTGKPQGLRRLDAPTTDAPTEVAVPADKAPAAKTYGVTTIEEPNVTRRPSGEGGTTAEQREITDAEAREMRGYTGGESAAANGQGAERKVTYIEEPNVQRRPVVNEDETATEDKPISDEDARKIRGYGDNVVDHTTAREIPKAISVYDIEKERQAKRDAEKAIADYDAKEYVRVMNSLKPKHDPVEWKEEEVPIIEDIEEEVMPGTTTTTEGGGESQGGNGTTTTEGGNGTEGGDQGGDDDSKLSDAEWYKKYFGIDEEEIARQKKAAKWAVAAQMLADSIGALSNVYWTGKGADAMKFEPGTPKAAAAANKMYADIAAAREKALKAALDEREKQFERAYRADRDRKQDEKDAQEYELRRQIAEDNKAWRETTRQDTIDQSTQAQENWQKEYELRRQQGNRLAQGAKTDTTKPETITLDDGTKIKIDKWDEDIESRIWRNLPKDVQDAIMTEEVWNKDTMRYERRTKQHVDRKQGILDHLNNPEVVNALKRAAGISVGSPEVKHSTATDMSGDSYSYNPLAPFPMMGHRPSVMGKDAKKHIPRKKYSEMTDGELKKVGYKRVNGKIYDEEGKEVVDLL